jgi:hypothetical protein
VLFDPAHSRWSPLALPILASGVPVILTVTPFHIINHAGVECALRLSREWEEALTNCLHLVFQKPAYFAE